MVYFMQAGDYIKIGRSGHPRARARELQTGCPHEIKLLVIIPIEGKAAKNLEKALHSILAEYEVRGEWFRAANAVLNTVNGLKRAYRATPMEKLRDKW